MDEQGIDIEALSINPFWYKAERDVARPVVKLQNEKLAEMCAAQPDRFVAFASVALQHPDLAAEQLEEGIKTARTARRADRRQRQGRGAVRSEISSVLGQGGGARRADLHPSAGRAGARLAGSTGNGVLTNVIG